MKRFLLLAATVLAGNLAFFENASAQVLSIYFVEEKDDGDRQLVPLKDVQNDEFPDLETNEERILDVYATEFFIGDLPDLWVNDISLGLTASTDVSKLERLGSKGVLGLSLSLRSKDNSRLEGFQARALLRNIPFKRQLDLNVSLWELDGDSKERVQTIKDIIISEKGDENETLIDLNFGNPYVQLAMAIYDAVTLEKEKNDQIWNSPFSFSTTPPIGLMPLKQGEWVLISTNEKKAAYQIAPKDDVVYDGDVLALTGAALADGKKMPTYLILSVVTDKQMVPSDR